MNIDLLTLHERLRSEYRAVKIDKNSSYQRVYPEFIRYFEINPFIEHHHLVISAHFVYGWMPTIFDFRSTEFDKALTILNHAKQGIQPNKEEFGTLVGLLNNSLAGTSKLLHFIRPDLFPIWDSRVYRFVFNREPFQTTISNISTYQAYMGAIKELVEEDWYKEIHQHIAGQLDYYITRVRSAENIMFERGKVGMFRKD